MIFSKNQILRIASVAEALTGLALLFVPSTVGMLLFGQDFTAVAIPVARVAGIALLSLAIVCWFGSPVVAMFTYSAAVMLYLGYLGIADGSRMAGPLLWPAVGVHLLFSVILAWAWYQQSARRIARP
jgi:hypothetical protein